LIINFIKMLQWSKIYEILTHGPHSNFEVPFKISSHLEVVYYFYKIEQYSVQFTNSVFLLEQFLKLSNNFL